MYDFRATKERADHLRNQKHFSEAAERYRTLWENHNANCDEWIGWGFAHCLRKSGDSQSAMQVCSQALEKWPDFDRTKNVLGWCLYDLEIKKDPEVIKQNESAFFAAANRILEITPQDPYSSTSKTVLMVTKYLKEAGTKFPAEQILHWLDRLDPAGLSITPWIGKGHKGKSRAQPADKVLWYQRKCKALHELGRHQECVAVGSEALNTITAFSGYDKWIKMSMARSYGASDDSDDWEAGLQLLDQLIGHGAEWYLHFDKAKLLYKSKKLDEALREAAHAASAGQKKLPFLVNIIAFIGKVLLEQGEKDLACQHVVLAAKIRKKEEWPIPNELQRLVAETDADVNIDTKAKALETELGEYWHSLKFQGMERTAGVIKNIIRSGKSGFIKGDDGKEYYFQIKDFKKATHGLRVSFLVKPNSQPGKKDIAVEIRES